MFKQNKEKVLEEIKRRLILAFHPKKIILFGSHAWGKPSPQSDLDIYVIVSESQERPAKREKKAHLCMDGIPLSIDILVRTQSEVDQYQHIPSSLEHLVLKKGRVLYG